MKSEELRVKSEKFLSVAALCESVPSGRAATARQQHTDRVATVLDRCQEQMQEAGLTSNWY